MKNTKKITLLMIVMMLCVFMSSGIVNAAAEAEDTGGSDVVLEHGADTSVWIASGNYHYNPCKVSDCTNSGHKYNWSTHWRKCNMLFESMV